MNFHHLSVFHAVADTGSVSAAAERLHISQPAVSRQVRELEASLGLCLFERMPRGMRLTEGGEVLAGYAGHIFELEHQAEVAMADLASVRAGRLLVGASTTIGNYLMPDLIARLASERPGLRVNLEVGNTEEIQKRLVDGELDIALTEGFADNPALNPTIFHTDQLVVVAAPGYLDANRDYVLPDLAALPWIMREMGSGTRAVLERALADEGQTASESMALASTEAIKRTVAAGAGIAVVSALTVRMELEAGTLVRLNVAGFPRARPLHCLLRRYQQPGPAVRSLQNLVTSQLAVFGENQ
jgi:DNA-binding transcriptional LysR family regulator